MTRRAEPSTADGATPHPPAAHPPTAAEPDTPPASPSWSDFTNRYDFPLDPFQVRACQALDEGCGVLVCAPTGAGKTVVGEYAVHRALRLGRKCFYTTPIKALSNQKYHDLLARYGSDQVGLLTGDNAINGDAPVVVMTTEVLRNMLYAGSPALAGLGFVVMDEVHYLADRFRGAVWEEVIIHLPPAVSLVSLSATVSNAEEFADWLVAVRGDTRVVVTEHRPVPLWQHMLVGTHLLDLLADDDPARPQRRTGGVNPELRRRVQELDRFAVPERRRSRGRPWRPPGRADVIERLDRDGLLPAITFIFSRAACADAVTQCVRGGLRLTTPEERQRIRRIVERRTAELSPADLDVLGYWEWLEALERGVAAHHAGMIPTFKETVEELFVHGLIKAVFATETLALGINMPARSVVLERLVKWNGEQHADITAGEYTQLTGRAGRRGIDVEGHAVVVWSPGVDPAAVAGLASTRTYPLRSSFSPSYNMAVNLVGQVGRDEARTLLESSFAQFQADRSVVGLARQVARNTEALEGYREAATCHLGDFLEYAQLRAGLKAREVAQARENASLRRAAAAESLERLKVGDVIRVPAGRRAGLAVILDPGVHPMNDPRPLILTEDRWAGRLSVADFTTPVVPLARVRVARNFNHRSPAERRDLASTLRNTKAGLTGDGESRRRRGAGDDPEITRLRAAIRQHPCHGCHEREDHARWAERFVKLSRETDALRRRVEQTTHSVARTFDRVCALLGERGYLDGDQVTPLGRQLSRVWSEADLLVTECLRSRIWEPLAPHELAGAVSVLIYESRRGGDRTAARVPSGPLDAVLDRTARLWAEVSGAEREHRLALSREPDAGFVWPAYRWCRGESLERVLEAAESAGQEMSPGDFVRWCRQLVDLLEQISAVATSTQLRDSAQRAVAAIRRGVVAYTGMT